MKLGKLISAASKKRSIKPLANLPEISVRTPWAKHRKLCDYPARLLANLLKSFKRVSQCKHGSKHKMTVNLQLDPKVTL